MKRFVFHFFAGASFLCLALATVFWIRSAFRLDIAVRDFTDQQGVLSGDFMLISNRGHLWIRLSKTSGFTKSVLTHSFRYRSSKADDSQLINSYIFNFHRFTYHPDFLSYPSRRMEWVRVPAPQRDDSNSNLGGTPMATSYALSIRYWIVVIAASIIPSFWIRQWRKRRRHRRIGLCQSCGYDLRATPGRCPECGRVPRELVRAGRR
jgi:hypothetical protein